jgi:hypothetical protein
MVEDVFQQVDEPMALEERTMEIVEETFVVANHLQVEVNVGNANNSEDKLLGNIEMDHEPLGEIKFEDVVPQDNSFDRVASEETIKELYKGSKCTKLVVTILLMNLWTMMHGINKFADELFTLLQLHLLLANNCSPHNYYATKILTRILGLDYKNIYACGKGSILFQGEYRDVISCPKCGALQYKDEGNRLFPVKVFRHFPLFLDFK